MCMVCKKDLSKARGLGLGTWERGLKIPRKKSQPRRWKAKIRWESSLGKKGAKSLEP